MDIKILLSRMRHSYFFVIGMILLVAIVAICYLLPYAIPHDYMTNNLTNRFAPPEWFARGFDPRASGLAGCRR